MFKNGKFLGKFNLIDFLIIGIVVIVLAGVVFVKNGLFRPLDKASKGVKPVTFTIVTRAYDVTGDKKLLKKGDKTFITIRNVPYTKLEVEDVRVEQVKEMFFNEDRPEVPYVIENVAYPNRVQYVVTLKDNAHITEDGAVIGGNKIKIGLPVDIEGVDYRLTGAVSSIKVLEEETK